MAGALIVAPIASVSENAAFAQADEPRAVPLDRPFDNLTDLETNGDKVYIVESAAVNGTHSGLITVLNATDFEPVANISEGYYPSELEFNPSTNTGYVLHSCNCPEGTSVSIIDGETDTVIGTLHNVTASLPTSIQVNEVTNKIYVTDGRTLSTIDGNTNTLTETITISNSTIRLMTINPDLDVIYGIDENKTLVSIDLKTYRLTRTNIAINSSPNVDAIDNRPASILVNPNTNMLYVVNEAIFPPPGPNEGMSLPVAYLIAVDMNSGDVLSDNLAEIQSIYFDLAVSPEKNVVYAVSGGNGILVVDGISNDVLGNYLFTIDPLENFYPKDLSMNSFTHSLYLAAANGIIVVPESYLVSGTGPPGPEYRTIGGYFENRKLGFSLMLPDSMEGFVYEYDSGDGKGLTLQVHPEFDSADDLCCPSIDVTPAALLLDSGPVSTLTTPVPFTGDLYAAMQGYNMTMSIEELDNKQQVLVATLDSERNDIPGYDTVKRIGKFYLLNSDERYVSYGLWASEENYQKYIDEFETSAKTLSVTGAKPVDLDLVFREYVYPDIEVQLAEGLLRPEIITPSIIESVVINENSNTISMNVTEPTGNSFLILNSGDLIAGPHSITLDGEPVESTPLSNEYGEYLMVFYDQPGNHEVAITGTAVIPEFGPFAALLAAAAIVGVVAMTKYMRRQDKSN